MKIQRASVIETPNMRVVEMLFANQPAPEEDEAQIRFVLPVSAKRYPRIAAAQLEALQSVRNVIGIEIARLEGIRGRAFPSEDWRK